MSYDNGIDINHENKNNNNQNHRVKGSGKIEIVDIILPEIILTSANSRRKKGVLFLEQLLEVNNEYLMK